MTAEFEMLERLAATFDRYRAQLPNADTASVLEVAAEEEMVSLVDHRAVVITRLDEALHRWLQHTRAPSGAHGQSMEATMAYDATRNLRAVAAHHLKETSDA